MTLQDDFDDAMARSRAATLTDEQKAGFYSLMMQSTVGDASGDRPDDPDEAARFDAWVALAGTSTEEAMQRFADLGATLPPVDENGEQIILDPDAPTLVRNARHNPDEPRHFMQIVPAGRRFVASLDGHTIADSTDALIVKEVGLDVYDPMVYFPRADVDMAQLNLSDNSSQCPLKGTTEYFDATIGGETIDDAAWSYVVTLAGPEIERLIAFDPSRFDVKAA